MCYPAPGPRCSNHARKTLTKAQRALGKAEQQIIWYQADRGPSIAPYPGFDDAGYRKWLSRRDTARAAMLAARDEYDATPAGMKALEHRLADLSALRAASAREGHYPVSAREVADLQARLDAGYRRRAHAKAAYDLAEADRNLRSLMERRFILVKTEKPGDDWVPEYSRQVQAAQQRIHDAEVRLADLNHRGAAATADDLAEAPTGLLARHH